MKETLELLDTEQARILLGCGKQRVYKLIKQNILIPHHTEDKIKYVDDKTIPYTKHWYLKEDVLKAKEVIDDLPNPSKLKQTYTPKIHQFDDTFSFYEF